MEEVYNKLRALNKALDLAKLFKKKFKDLIIAFKDCSVTNFQSFNHSIFQ
jgi:hypothetical protein